MSQHQRDSLHLKQVDTSILYHLFLPCYLPSSNKNDYLIQDNHRNEHEILICMKDFLQSLDEKLSLPIFSIIVKCINNWLNLQDSNNLNIFDLQSTIEQLEPGDFFSLYFHTQNAAILIEMDENDNNQPLISSWQVSLPTNEITSSLKPHLSCFPMPTYRLKDRSQLSTRAHCSLLLDFIQNPIEYAKSTKSSYQFDETRDVPESHYVCQWWIMQFQGITKENNGNACNQFTKKHRDQIRWKDTAMPFRRSGLWMTIKVVLQTILIKHLKSIGTIVYKLLITHFLAYVISIRHVDASTEFLVHCLRKIVRRLNKIDGLLSDIDSNEWIQFTIQEIQSKLKQILPNSDWQSAIKLHENQKQKLSVNNINLNDSQIYQHSFQELKTYLDKNVSNNSSKINSGFNNHFYATTSAINQMEKVPSMDVLINQWKYTVDRALTYIEIWVESYLEQWFNRPSSCVSEENCFKVLLDLFEKYQSYALGCYYSKENPSDSIGYSRFILTSLTIIYCMHRKLWQDERFERLKLHSIYIPCLFKLFEYLILPNRDDMERADRLYKYFNEFKSKQYPDLLAAIESENAFGVYFANGSPKMNASLEEIQNQSERDKQAKIEEVIREKHRSQQLMDSVSGLSCQCTRSRRRRIIQCHRCSTIAQANNIKVLIHECPIPSERFSKLAVIFELQMPIEIRCYREIIWQFINRPQPNPSQHMFAWLEIPPTRDKLRRYCMGPVNINVKLVSSTESLTQSHYYSGRPVISSSTDDFIFESCLTVEISPNTTISLEKECLILTPQLTDQNYKPLQFTLSSTRFVQNEVIANLSDCPIRMKPTQFIEFGSFRSGDCLQWWNLLSVLEMESLPIEEESVAMLIVHSLLQYGPVSETQNSWCPKSHRVILEDHFVDELISRLNHRLDDCEYNWQNELVLIVITMITMRILTICNATRGRNVTSLALRCRSVGENWISLISKSIQYTSSLNLNEIGNMRNKMTTVGIACLITYSVNPVRTNWVLSTNEDIVSLLKAITTIHDNIILNKNQIYMSTFMNHMMRFSERTLVSIQPLVSKLLGKFSYQSLNEFSVIYWAAISSKGPINGNWRKRTTDIYDGWFDGNYESNRISIDCFRGTFLVNDMTIGFLPENVTSNRLFLRVFDNHIFEVQADASSNDTYITKHTYHGKKNVRYTFHIDNRIDHVTIYEQHEKTDDRFQLISDECFANELPDALVSNYSHWRNTKSEQIEFRPVKFTDSHFLNDKIFMLTMKTGYVTTSDNTQILVNQSSRLFQSLYTRYFNRLDDMSYVYMMRDDASYILDRKSSESDIIIHVHLSRLGIAFKYNCTQNIITSREYSDMCVAEDQWLGTLTGLQSGLLLSPMATSNTKYEYYQCRKLIVPFGEIHAKKKAIDHHQIVAIQRTSFVHQYFAFNLNDRLRIIQSTDSPTGWLYLALLHAMTSHPLPDQYTGMTGMERSFQLLNSAGCWNDQPFDEISLNILYQIAAISPRVEYYPPHLTVMEKIQWKDSGLPYSMQHFGYYLMVEKLVDTSQQLVFMYPSLDFKMVAELAKNNKNDVKLLGKLYWDYRDSYNPAARLTKEMEDEIFRTCSSTQYHPTSMNCPYSTNYEPMCLTNDMYKSGDVILKDISQLNCFPLYKWLEKEFALKAVWIGLLKQAYTTRNNRDDFEQFEILLSFLHYISTKQSIQPFYLQMLRTVLTRPAITLRSVTFPKFDQYERIEEISVRKDHISFSRDVTESKRNEILEEIEKCFKNNRTFKKTKENELFLYTSEAEINILLKSWQANKQLRSFLESVQNSICSDKMMEPLNRNILINPQQFTLESIRDHHRIIFNEIHKPINPKLINDSQQKFCHRSSDNLMLREINHRRMEFPDEIFSSINNQENPLFDIGNHFKTQLYKSWEQFLSVKEYRKEHPSIEGINILLDSYHLESKLLWNELVTSITSTNNLLVETGVLSRVIPTTLISIFLRTWLNDEQQVHNSDILLTKDQCMLLGGTIVNWTFEQQLERALHFQRNKRIEDFEKELSNRPHTNWIPSEHLPWLILELEMNITIREIQVDVAYHMMQSKTTTTANTKVRNIVMQMNMGEGKTSVIIPMLALSLCSSSSSLVRIVVLKSLFTINYQSLRYKLGGLLNRRIFPFVCRRNLNFNYNQLHQIDQRFKQGLIMKDIILTSPEYILSFDLLTIDKCRRNESDVNRLMLNMQKWLKKYVRDVLDESDEILHVKYQLIYTVGGQEQVDGGPERWKIIQSILELVRKHARDISIEFSKEVYYKPNERKSAFPQFRLLSNKPFSVLCEKVANDWLNEKNYRENDQQRISSFILDNKSSIESLDNQFSSDIVKIFLILRGLLSSEVLLVALKKRHRVNYGVNENPVFNRLMAVPFRAKDVAAENTEFGHPDVAIILTQLSYYYSGLDDAQLKQCFQRLNRDENDPALIYHQWISYDDQNHINPSIRQWNGVNLNDYQQRTQHLFPILRYNMLMINYFLDYFVFPREAKQFPHKLIGSAWDLSSSSNRSHIVTGFSGTNDTQLLLPVHIRQCDLPQLQKTDALVVSNLLQRENKNYQPLSIDTTSDKILEKIVEQNPPIHVILDVGALFIDGTNREIAVKWLKLSDKSKIDYAVYFESDSIFACDRQFHHHSFLTSPASERLDHCVFYLDEIHTRGSDFKFPKGFRAALTLGHGLTKDRLVQAAMRMRQLGNGHSLIFWSPYEVHQQIQTLKQDLQRRNRDRNISEHDREITLFDILRWVYENTQQATWDGLHHWAAQSLNFQRKMNAFRDIEWNNPQQSFTDTMIQDLASKCLEPEVIKLEKMFGASKYLRTAYDIYLSRYEYSKSKVPLSTEIHNDVLKQIKKYGGSKTRLAQLLDEEQERELEQELEEERQVDRPPPVKPHIPVLHEAIKKLCHMHGDMLDLAESTSVFRPLAYAFTGTTFVDDCQPNSWHQNFWISTEFQRVIKTIGESLDQFLRPPRWVVIYRKQHVIFLSAHEANWLMNHLNPLYYNNHVNNSPITTLRLLLPRVKQSQSVLVNTPSLTIPPTMTPCNETAAFNIPLEWLVELFVFSGTLYFKNNSEQTAYCECLGICPKPRTPAEDQAFQKSLIAVDGFVHQCEHRSMLHIDKCRFNTSPVLLVKKIIENRNNSEAPLASHAGSIIYKQLKLIENKH